MMKRVRMTATEMMTLIEMITVAVDTNESLCYEMVTTNFLFFSADHHSQPNCNLFSLLYICILHKNLKYSSIKRMHKYAMMTLKIVDNIKENLISGE